jgi:hypothetical protein
MTETLQAVVVSFVALAALLVLLRPILRRKPPASGAGGCANCSASQEPTRRN